MPPASLSDFPVEVLIRLYKSLNTVKDITALNLASSRLHNVWLSNTVSISDAVLSRTIESYDDACELAKLQQKFPEPKQCDKDVHNQVLLKDVQDQQLLARYKLAISNAPRLRDVWLSNAGSVSDVKLSYITEDYDGTYEHAEIQQKLLERKQCDDHGPDQQMLERNKLILSNAHLYHYFYEVTTNLCSSEPWFNSDETLWSKIYYCLCILDFAEEDTSAQSPRLASLNLKTMEAIFSLFTSYVAVIIPCLARIASGGGPLRTGLEALGKKRAGSTLLDFRYMLANQIMALKKGGEVGNSIKNA